MWHQLSLQLKYYFTVFFIDLSWKFTIHSEKCITRSRKCYKNRKISYIANTQILSTLHPNPNSKIKSWDEIDEFITTINTKMAHKWLVSIEKAWWIKGWIFLESYIQSSCCHFQHVLRAKLFLLFCKGLVLYNLFPKTIEKDVIILS